MNHIRTISLTEKEKDMFSMAMGALDHQQNRLVKKGLIDKKYFKQIVEIMESLNNKILL